MILQTHADYIKRISLHLQAVCSAIAVLLHYMWLVVFMWMLMEGVVLFLVLVVVFVRHNTTRFIIGFTVASYGQYIYICNNNYAACTLYSYSIFSQESLLYT